MNRMGAGFNYAFVDGYYVGKKLTIPSCVNFIEMGIAELKRACNESWLQNIDFSLHLSRTPVTEAANVQDAFIDFILDILDNIPHDIRKNLASIGLHLTGSRFTGNGLLGGADTYAPSNKNLDHTFRFIQQLKLRTNLDIWLENANFYSLKPEDIVGSWDHVKQVCESEKCGIIFDVAHAIIEASNNDLPPDFILGCVPWAYIKEFHLSGITSGKDGSMHDGHDSKIADSVWKMLTTCQKLIQTTQNNKIIYTIEHTAPSWVQKSDLFESEFKTLETFLSSSPVRKCYSENRDQYMRRYLQKMASGRIPLLEQACEQRGMSLSDLMNIWLDTLSKKGERVVFDADEIPKKERDRAKVLTVDFLEFAKKELEISGSHCNDC